MHKARSSHLLPFRIDIEETREALSAEQVRKKNSDLEKILYFFLLVNDLEKIL
jgi:hypothetical protein